MLRSSAAGTAVWTGPPSCPARRIVSVDVQDRSVEGACDIGAIQRRSLVPRMRHRRADLIVQDEMQRSADPVATRLRQVECFGHYALAGERGVAVNKNGQHLTAGT